MHDEKYLKQIIYVNGLSLNIFFALFHAIGSQSQFGSNVTHVLQVAKFSFRDFFYYSLRISADEFNFHLVLIVYKTAMYFSILNFHKKISVFVLTPRIFFFICENYFSFLGNFDWGCRALFGFHFVVEKMLGN